MSEVRLCRYCQTEIARDCFNGLCAECYIKKTRECEVMSGWIKCQQCGVEYVVGNYHFCSPTMLNYAPKIGRFVDEQPTLRDQFAMAALTGFEGLPDNNPSDWNQDEKAMNEVAKFCYQYADAMMAARKQSEKGE